MNSSNLCGSSALPPIFDLSFPSSIFLLFPLVTGSDFDFNHINKRHDAFIRSRKTPAGKSSKMMENPMQGCKHIPSHTIDDLFAHYCVFFFLDIQEANAKKMEAGQKWVFLASK